MKSERAKGFISGVITASLVISLIGAAGAAVGQKMLKADYTNIKISVDGTVILPTDASGAYVEPFAVNGTTYLPVRAVANAVGYDVDWDQSTKTVLLTSSGEDLYYTDECYPDFSVPTLDNIVGFDSYVDLYALDSGDSIAYYYDMLKFDFPDDANPFTEYFNLLKDYGYVQLQSVDNVTYFDNSKNGVTVAMYIDETTDYFVVLVMALSDSERKTLPPQA